MKYRRVPELVDAIKWTGKNHKELYEFIGHEHDEYMHTDGANFYINNNGSIVINRKVGSNEEIVVPVNYMLIRNSLGVYKSCSLFTFENLYEEITTDIEDKRYNGLEDIK